MEAHLDAPSSYLTLERPVAPSAIRCKGSWFFATFAPLTLFPFFGTLLVLFAYDDCQHLLSPRGAEPVACGVDMLLRLCMALVVWCAVSLVICHFAGTMRADMANRSAYAAIAAEMNAIFAHMCDFWDTLGQAVPEGKDHAKVTIPIPATDEERRRVGAYTAACMQYTKAYYLLTVGGPHWVSGAGYVNVSSVLHRAEEALIEFEDKIAAIGDALYDHQRIETSTINDPQRTSLLKRIKDAACSLSPETCRLYWSDDNKADESNDSSARAASQPADGAAAAPAEGQEHGAEDSGADPPALAPAATQSGDQTAGRLDCAARATLRVVRRTMNEMRDSIRLQLVDIRARTIELATFLGVAVFVLVTASVLADWHLHADAIAGPATASAEAQVSESTAKAEARMVLGPIIFFLVGAATGLVYRLYSDSSTGIANNVKGSEDSDLADVPPELPPLVSGIAAIAGIVITGGVTGLTAGHSGAGIAPSITTLFDQTTLGPTILVAALFGFAPGLLFDRLAQYTATLKKDLQASSAAPPTAPPSKSS